MPTQSMSAFIHQIVWPKHHPPPATLTQHIHASCIHENPQSSVQSLIWLSSVCVSVFLKHTKTCINTYCTCMRIHTVCCTAVITASDCGLCVSVCVCAVVLCCVLWNGWHFYLLLICFLSVNSLSFSTGLILSCTHKYTHSHKAD